MGGMFDPVHHGHLSSALSAVNEFGLDELRLIPCGSPVHRQAALASDGERVAMLEQATQAEPRLVVDDRECSSNEPSYTVNTLESIRMENEHAKLFLIMGVDAFNTLTTWLRWQDLFHLAHLIVIARPGWTVDTEGTLSQFIETRQVASFNEMSEANVGKVLIHSFTPMMIGSTQIRKLINEKRSARYLLPDAVWSYIKTKNLYT